MSEERFERRRRGERRRRLLRIAVPVLVVVLLGVVVWLVWFSGALAVRKVEVTGLRTLKTGQVERIADVPVGRPLARLDTTAVRSRLARISRIEDVQVKRSWPHTVRIEVVERRAVAWTRSGATIRAVDKDGVDYRALPRRPRLPEIRVTAVDARRRQQAFEASAAVLVELKARAPDVLRALQHVEATTKDSVLLVLSRGREVMWGSAAHGGEKTKVLRALLRIRATRYDVSAPEQPTTRK